MDKFIDDLMWVDALQKNVRSRWRKSAKCHSNLSLNALHAMPNHIDGIRFLMNNPVEADLAEYSSNSANESVSR